MSERLPGALRRAALALAVLALAACEDGTGPSVAALEGVSGSEQPGVVGKPLAHPLVVRALSASGQPLAGRTVSFRVVAGDGSLSATSVKTDASGLASVTWTPGTTAPGWQYAEAYVGENSFVVSFRSYVVPGAPTTVTYVSGNNQTALVGQPLPQQLAVLLRDQYGNPTPHVLVNWSSPSGGGSFSPSQTQADVDGIARTTWTMGPAAGTQTAVASTIAGNVQFQATAQGAPPTVRVDSARIRGSTTSAPGYEIAAHGLVSWPAGQNPTIWWEWSTSPTMSPLNATQQVTVTRTDVTAIGFSQPLTSYTYYDQTPIYYRLVASNAYGVTRSAVHTFTPPPPPAPPVNFRARFDASRMTVVLEWDNPMGVMIERRWSSTDTTWYNIHQREQGHILIQGTSFEDVTFDVRETTAGEYRARASSCLVESACPWVYTPAIAIVPLAPPSGLQATLNGSGVQLQWTDNATNEYRYSVWRNGSVIAYLPANATSYTDFATVPGTTYTYTIRAQAVYRPFDPGVNNSPAIGASRFSHPSNEVAVTLPP